MACFLLTQKWPVLINSLWENGCRQRKTVFRYETSMKFAKISGGFGRNLNFELIEKFPWGTPFAEFSKLWGRAARQQGNAGRRNLVCWFERSRVLIRHRFQQIFKWKFFYHPTVWHVFLAQKWPVLINSLWENGCRQRKTVFRYETNMKFANISGGFGRNLNFELIEKFPWGTPFAEFSKLWGSAARQQGNAGQPNLVCWCERSRVLIRHRFQKISKRKIFYHPAVWHVFLAHKWPVLIN